ncbi:alkaline phosphatase D family protein [Roseomonas populi]|uniref:Alkaline phosphatase D family protein n=1 Tax=Roseomonas populi TaxID=3121582 RepID=A0ABT1WYI5_9PROT|nr:alkaline phosphatase D family protein [Roseomonas pecuniae]MCR0980908.1 alkaline phosphatase D family protein [Roseomonas pecuniae]
MSEPHPRRPAGASPLLVPRRAALALPGLALFGHFRARAAEGDPFLLGVASGEPAPGGFVLWTRLATEWRGGGMPAQAVPVDWVVARDEGLRDVVRRGQAVALPEDVHSVHVELSGLEPDRPYWYRFTALGAASETGRARTTPPPGAAPARLRFAFASCQNYEAGFYGAYRHMLAEDPDLVVFLGDYIYEASTARNPVRSHEAPTARDLAGYRDRYALYKTDPDLRAMHRACPWLVTWDDHEVSNDYADDRDGREEGEAVLRKRAAAYKAFWEHMPLPESARPRGAATRIYRRAGFGGLARFHILDDRQYRGHQPCPKPGMGGGNLVPRESCPALDDPGRTMLGAAQEAWLREGLAEGGARWTILAQQTRMARFGTPEAPHRYQTDNWDGYPAARRRLLEDLVASGAPNPIVIGGDVHAHVVSTLRPDFDRPEAAPVAVEFTGTSISSPGPRYGGTYPDDPHVAYADGRSRGYVMMTLTPETATAELRALTNVRDRETGITTPRRYVVEAGRSALTAG